MNAKRLLPAVMVAGLTGIACAPAVEPNATAQAVRLEERESARKEAEVHQGLQRRIPEAKFSDMTLKEAMDRLRSVTAVSIRVKWAALETAGITPDTKIKEVMLKDATAARVLRAVLDDVGGTTRLGYIAWDGDLVISTVDDLSGVAYRRTVIYDVRDIIAGSPAEPNAAAGGKPEANAPAGTAPQLTGASGGPSGVGPGPGAASPAAPRTGPGPVPAAPPPNAGAAGAEELARLIAVNVDHDSWRDPYGTGDVGTMTVYGGLLVVQQTMPNHEKITELLADIRRHRPTFR